MAERRGLGWYAKRLSVMGPREILHRAGETARLQYLRLQSRSPSRWSQPPPGLADKASFCVAAEEQLPTLDWNFEPGSPEVRELMSGRLSVMGCQWQWSEKPEVWHRAPDTDAVWPQRFFNDIGYRAGNPCGDVRIAWEPSRLQWLISLALLARSSAGRERREAVAFLEKVLLSWVAANPPLFGIHYISAMECALRLMAACHAVDLVRAYLTRPAEVWQALLALVSSHAALIERRLSLYSSAGNHTVAESAGLIYAGVLFPELAGARRFRGRGLRLLEQEIGRQILEDGGGLEQAFWYLRFITDLGELVLMLLRRHGEAVSQVLVERTGAARRFLNLMCAGTGGPLPPIGDADDGHALSPWLRLDRAVAEPPVRVTFPYAGYTLCRGRESAATTVLVDHGPLGMPPSFGHGHADALAVTIWQAGRPLLIDPGTYSYFGDPGWRAYFRSTAAHNTVCVDNSDQATQETPFMWSAPFRCELVRSEEGADGTCRVFARLDGYRRLGNVVHWRGVSVRPGGAVVIWDFLTGEGRHRVALNWHSGMPVTSRAGAWELGDCTILEVEGAQTVGCSSGGTARTGGWQAPHYGEKQPICTIKAEYSGTLPCQFLSRIYLRGSPVPREWIAEDLKAFRDWMA